MKKTLCFLVSICVCFCTFAIASQQNIRADDFSLSATEFVKKIGVGWNLGNTLDAHPTWGMNKNPTAYEQETGWNNPYTSTKMIDLIKSSGFNAIRIPVTWYPQVTANNGTYSIKTAWINRVKEIVDYCIMKDMYVIVNMHHDDHKWLNISATEEDWENVKDKYTQLWVQIADAFKDYDEHLVLEGANEITPTYAFDDNYGYSTEEENAIDKNHCWWGLHNPESPSRVNELYRIFYKIVRKSGGNNDKRYLLLPTVGAQGHYNGSFLEKIYMPAKDNRMIVDIHWYNKDNVQMNSEERAKYIAYWKSLSKSRGFAVILGECGLYESESSTTKVEWANAFVKQVRQENIPVFLWDDGGNYKIMDRKNAVWTSKSTEYVKAVINAGKISQSTTNATATPPKPVMGDVTGDYLVKAIDVLIFKKYLAKNTIPSDCTVTVRTVDMNSDGKLDTLDLLLMRQKIVGIN